MEFPFCSNFKHFSVLTVTKPVNAGVVMLRAIFVYILRLNRFVVIWKWDSQNMQLIGEYTNLFGKYVL